MDIMEPVSAVCEKNSSSPQKKLSHDADSWNIFSCPHNRFPETVNTLSASFLDSSLVKLPINAKIPSKSVSTSMFESIVSAGQAFKSELNRKTKQLNVPMMGTANNGNQKIELYCEDYCTANGPVRIAWAIDGYSLDENVYSINSMELRRQYFEHSTQLEALRHIMMSEHDGSGDMFGVIFTPPVTPDAHVGAIFVEGGGYLTMCGHASMGAAMSLVDKGIIPVDKNGLAAVKFDTAAGLVTAYVDQPNRNVTLLNVESELAIDSLEVDVPLEASSIRINTSISYGGNYFALVDLVDLLDKLSAVGIKVESDENHLANNLKLFQALSLVIRRAVNAKISESPLLSNALIRGNGHVDLVEIFEPTSEYTDAIKGETFPVLRSQNLVIFGDDVTGQYDLSPCGTGTSAKLAMMFNKQKISIGQAFAYKSVTGSTFVGRILQAVPPTTHNNPHWSDRSELPVRIVPMITGHVKQVGVHKAELLTDAQGMDATLRLYDYPANRCWNLDADTKLDFDTQEYNEIESSRKVFELLSNNKVRPLRE